MKFLLCLVAVGMAMGSALTNRLTPDSASGTLLVSMEESQIDLSPNGITYSNCLNVRPGGFFHLERRKQQLPGALVALQVYEDLLSADQMQELSQVIDANNVKELEKFTPPQVPGNPTLRRGFLAQIFRPAGVQSVGYMDWPSRDREGAPEAASDETRQQQEKADFALMPLVFWLHRLEESKLSPLNAEANHCAIN